MSAEIVHRRDDIQLLRAFAVVAVVVFHGGPWMPNGYLGVDVFFAISGFVITSSVERRFLVTGTFSIKDFLSRRVRRLVPASVVVLIATATASLLFESWIGEQWRTQSTAFFSLFSVSNIWFLVDQVDYFSISNEKNLFLHTWSLSVEEQFYLGFAIVGALIVGFRKRLRLGRNRVTMLVAFMTAMSFVVYMVALRRVMESPDSLGLKDFIKTLIHPFYGPVSRSWEFGAGVVVALVHSRVRTRSTWSVVGFLAIIGMSFLPYQFIETPGLLNLLAVAATCAVLLTDLSGIRQPFQLFMTKISGLGVAIGDRSYSIYLWHWPILVIVNRFPNLTQSEGFFVSLGIIAFMSEVTFRCIERPILDSTKALRGRGILMVSWASALVVIAGSSLLATPMLKRASGVENGFVNRGCDPWVSVCVEGKPDHGAILLVGDSHAMAIKEAVLDQATKEDLGLVMCVRECLDETAQTQLVSKFPIRSVVIAWAWNSWGDVRVEYLEELSQLIDPKRFVIVYDNPRFPEWFAPSLLGPQARGVTRSDALEEQAVARELIRGWVRTHKSITVDLLDDVCDQRFCPVRLNGEYLYVDDNHLSLYGVSLVSKSIGDAIEESLTVE